VFLLNILTSQREALLRYEFETKFPRPAIILTTSSSLVLSQEANTSLAWVPVKLLRGEREMLDWTAQEGRFGDLIWTNTLVLPALAAVTIPFVESEGTPLQ